MRSKTPLVLMEQLVMVLIFALAAALCLRCFVGADRLSARYALRDDGVLAAQTAAETVKSCAGDYEKAAQLLGGRWSEGRITVTGDSMTLFVIPADSGNPLLGSAAIEVYAQDDDRLLFDLTVMWQEVGSGG